ncbi:MAG: SagB family peptide dehydrogenase [Siculibacillus sp.]|nr:SagB family peptide dehydrogenase [Siculibacillus sp.]
MTLDPLLRLVASAGLHEFAGELVFARGGAAVLRLKTPTPGLRALIAALKSPGAPRDTLVEIAVTAEADVAVPMRAHHLIAKLDALGLVERCLRDDAGHDLATLEPMTAAFRPKVAVASRAHRLSRFALLRRDGETVIAESPLAHARVRLYDESLAASFALLARPRVAAEIAEHLPALPSGAAERLIDFLLGAGVVLPCDETGLTEEDRAPALRQWEFHDLLFHTRSRIGRHDHPFGGTYPFLGDIPPLPAVRPCPGETIALPRPDDAAIAARDVPFHRVSETRRSIREPAETPITLAELSEFLHRSAGVRLVRPVTGDAEALYDSSLRPAAAGGAIHEIDLHLTVSRCDGLAPGLYRYDPFDHALAKLSEFGDAERRLLADARRAAGGAPTPDVLLTLSSRFQRIAWKYRGMAYAATLKNVGALYQQMYLVATAMGLAPCGLGSGDSDLFAAAAGLDYFVETSVGEFMLSRG